MLDFAIVLIYFAVVFIAALSGRTKGESTSEEYFLSNRNLRWPSIALSTIATNIQGYQFLGMMGSAYLYGLAQANLEINAMQGLLMAAFIFVPMYLRERIMTITQFIQMKLGRTVGLVYSIANILLFATVGLGAALFWGAYAADLVFSDILGFISDDRLTRITALIIFLGVFSAIYTYLGGLQAVVKTDVIQFFILLIGGTVVLFVAINQIGGWGQLYEKAPELMHLHLPSDHDTLPWTAMFGLFFLNINYWCANQTVMQRSLAARSLKEAQVGLMFGGVMKYFMAVIIVIPGIALAVILEENPLTDPDQAFVYLVNNFLPIGLKGLILCALFASLMSTVDSTFNSIATLFSIDIYKGVLRKDATDQQVVATGRRTILFTLVTGITMAWVLLYIKFEDPTIAFTHKLNELRYFINCGIVVLICASALALAPKERYSIMAFLSTIPLNLVIMSWVPDMNYFVRAGVVIVFAFASLFLFRTNATPFKELFKSSDDTTTKAGWVLAVSLVVLHVVFG